MPMIFDQKLECMINALFEEGYKSRPLSVKLKELGYDMILYSITTNKILSIDVIIDL